jgi:acyl-CoA reductase-like NAD-dependent aldehyde dehydrogenase
MTQPTGAPPWGSPDPSGPVGGPRAPSAGAGPDRPPAGPLFEVRDPATEAVIERVPAAGAGDADAAVERAAAAFEGWRAVAPADRARLLRRLAERLDAERERLAQLEMRNAGKPIGDARGEMGMVVDTFAYYAGAPERLLGDTIPVAGGVDLTFREPLGVVGLIVPWNFPLMLAAWKLAPALAAGNTVVLKPAGLTPLTALAFAELASEAGIPPGVVNVLPGPGRLVGRRLVEHPKVAKVAFTGSTEVGREVMRGAAGTIKRVTLELGGKSANVVFADADLPAAAAAAPLAVFGNAGQDCCARSRILVERSAIEEFLALLEPAVTGLRVGDPADERTQMGPLISAGQREAVASFVPEGTPVAIRGSAPDGPGHWFPPTVLTGLAPGDRAVTEEIFGPVVVVLPFADEAEAVRLANATIYGLSGSIWTRDVGRALRVARAVETGTLSVNSNTSVRVATPFGGFKQSGVGRELGPHALDHYTEVKNVFLATGG